MSPSTNLPDRQAEAFPVLTPAQIARVRPYGKVRSVSAGEVLFEPGKLGCLVSWCSRESLTSQWPDFQASRCL